MLLGFLAAVAFAFMLIFSIPRPDPKGTPYAAFLAHKSQWISHKPQAYQVRVEGDCFDCIPWNVRTRIDATGTEDSTSDATADGSDMHSDKRQSPRNVDDVFRFIEAAYERKAYSIDLTFDENFGFPTHAYIDKDLNTVDDEWVIRVSEFEMAHGD